MKFWTQATRNKTLWKLRCWHKGFYSLHQFSIKFFNQFPSLLKILWCNYSVIIWSDGQSDAVMILGQANIVELIIAKYHFDHVPPHPTDNKEFLGYRPQRLNWVDLYGKIKWRTYKVWGHDLLAPRFLLIYVQLYNLLDLITDIASSHILTASISINYVIHALLSNQHNQNSIYYPYKDTHL